MRFGHFDNRKREYVIERPDTPLPWMNYMGLKHFFGMISNTGGGYAFMVDARKQRLTRYRYNNAPFDNGGRYAYVRDSKTGDVWSPTWMPVRSKLDFYECRHGMGYTIITGQRRGVRISTKYFVPLDEAMEIWEMDLLNTSKTKKTIQLFTFVEFCLWEALNDATNLQRTLNLGEVEVEGGVIYHKTEYRERRSHFAYFACSEPLAGFDTDREAFLGPYRGLHEPIVVETGKSGNGMASGWNPCGSHQLRITLEPGKAKRINFLLGFGENPEDRKFSSKNVLDKSLIKPVIDKYLDRKNSNTAFDGLQAEWNDLLDRFQVDTPEKPLNTMVNTWNQYQDVVTFNMARSASFYETGIGRGIGFRDACQDLFGVVHLLPAERTRQRILDLAAIQWRGGDCYHQYQLLDKKGNADMGVGFNDDPCWLILATAHYIRETGDWSILDENAPFDNNPNDAAPLYEHLRASIQYILNHLGPHGLPKIGRADWNDCLNLTITSIKPGDMFQSDAEHAGLDDPVGRVPESLMIAAQFVWAGREFGRMAEQKNDTETVERINRAVGDMIRTVEHHGWDGEWFLRA
ncbi:MAG TPA: glycosyl transferase, partial [bacterium]